MPAEMSEADTTLDYVPVRDALAGSSEGENIRHMLVRVAFTNEFRLDERVEALCHEWGVRYGLESPALALAHTLESLAEATGVENRGVLLEKISQLESSEDGNHVLVDPNDRATVEFANSLSSNQALIDRVDTLADDLLEKFAGVDDRAVASEAVQMVKSLLLPWPWLAVEIIEAFVFGLWGFAKGQIIVIDQWVEHPDLPTPHLSFRFRTRSSETISEALVRFVRDAQQFIVRLMEPAVEFPRGRIPTDFRDEIENGVGRYGRWFYRHRIRGDSINAIARDAVCDRATVRYGLREAERLLSLAAYTF